MASKSAFSPELRAKLAEKQRYLVSGQKAISQFARFAGPDGKYYFRLAKVSVGVDRKTGGMKFNFKFVCVATVESRSPEFAGSPMNITFRCFTTKNSTEEENWNRFYTDGLQALGHQTHKWPADQAADMLDNANSQLNEIKPPVVLDIRTNNGFQNANIVEVLRADALEEFTQPSLEVSDEIPDDEHEEPETAQSQLDALKVRLDAMGGAELLAAAQSQNISVNPTAGEAALRSTIYKHFETVLLGTPSPETQASASAPAPDEEVLEEPVEEGVEELLDDSTSDKVIAIVKERDRKSVQRAIKHLDPTFKFYAAPAQTDDWLKETLVTMLTSGGESLMQQFLTTPF